MIYWTPWRAGVPQRQPAAYPDRHFGLRRVLHLCAGGGTGFLQLLLQLCGGATVLLGPVGCYLFAFDLFNIRTRCTLVERFRHTKQYPFYCVCVMLSWLLLCFFCNVPGRRRIRQQKVKAV